MLHVKSGIEPHHKQVMIYHPKDQWPVEVDEGISSLIAAMWIRGFETLYSCEGGVMEWKGEDVDQLAYISMPNNEKNWKLTQELVNRFDLPWVPMDECNAFVLEFDNHIEFGKRIIWRFPNYTIGRLERFIASVRS